MKRFLCMTGVLLAAAFAAAQNLWPEQPVCDMNGRVRRVADYANEKGCTLLVFWKTCCPNNIAMLDELYDAWSGCRDRERIRIVLVSVDDQRTAARVRPVVRSSGWGWEVVMDRNGELARSCHAVVPPQWIALDRSGKEIFRCKITRGATDSELYFDELISIIDKLEEK